MKAKVAILRVSPESILTDVDRLVDLAGVSEALDRRRTTILKDNISWHFPFPAANTTPWQLEGTIRALHADGFTDLVCVQNKTVVTDAFKGEDLNGYLPIFRAYDIPVLYNFKDSDMRWVEFQPKARMRVLNQIFPEGIHIPDFFFGKNIVHLPTVKCHIYSGQMDDVLAEEEVRNVDALRKDLIEHAHASLRLELNPAHIRVLEVIKDGDVVSAKDRQIAVEILAFEGVGHNRLVLHTHQVREPVSVERTNGAF